MVSHRKERESRLTETRSGAWASSSQHYLHVATDLFKSSAVYAKLHDGNVSLYPLAGIPLLVSTLRAVLIEANAGMYGLDGSATDMSHLAQDPNEVKFICDKYLVNQSTLAENLTVLYEVRNEIVHPAHKPAGTKDNTPINMAQLRERGLLQSTGKADADYTWIEQLQSHRLFRWSFETVGQIAEQVLTQHCAFDHISSSRIESYQRYRKYDLPLEQPK